MQRGTRKKAQRGIRKNGQRGIPDITTALELFLLDCSARRLAPATRQFYQSHLNRFIEWLLERRVNALDDLTAHHIREFLVTLNERGTSSQYQNNAARCIRVWLNYCVRDELLEESPFARVRLPKIEKKVLPSFTMEEIKAVLRACLSTRDYALCLFLLDSGVRASEMINLNVGDVELNTGAVHVRYGKGQKGRIVYVGVKTRKGIRRYLMDRGEVEDSAVLFASEGEGERLTLSGVVQLMERLRKRSGVKTCQAHTFRRTFAINCLRSGMNIYVLAKLMGHTDIVILKQYLALVETDLKQAHERFGMVDNLL